MLRQLKSRLGAFWRQLEHGGPQERRVLVVMDRSSCQDDLRIWAIENQWQLSFALTLQNAMAIQRATGSNVIIHDQALPGVDWRQGLQTILGCAKPAMAIVLSDNGRARICRSVLGCGAYALARKPMDEHAIVPLVNGALQLAADIDSLYVSESVRA